MNGVVEKKKEKMRRGRRMEARREGKMQLGLNRGGEGEKEEEV